MGKKIGPNPTDRAKNGSKHSIITDGGGVPLIFHLKAANETDYKGLPELVDDIPPIKGPRGRPRFRPVIVQTDRGYDSEEQRIALRQRGIVPLIAKRYTPHGSGLGVYRWVVERTISWLHQYRRLRIRWERRTDIHEAFLWLACILVIWKTFL